MLLKYYGATRRPGFFMRPLVSFPQAARREKPKTGTLLLLSQGVPAFKLKPGMNQAVATPTNGFTALLSASSPRVKPVYPEAAISSQS